MELWSQFFSTDPNRLWMRSIIMYELHSGKVDSSSWREPAMALWSLATWLKWELVLEGDVQTSAAVTSTVMAYTRLYPPFPSAHSKTNLPSVYAETQKSRNSSPICLSLSVTQLHFNLETILILLNASTGKENIKMFKNSTILLIFGYFSFGNAFSVLSLRKSMSKYGVQNMTSIYMANHTDDIM